MRDWVTIQHVSPHRRFRSPASVHGTGRCELPSKAMLIGAHVSTAGGLDKSVERAETIGARSMQIFNQSPRMWRPTVYTNEQFDLFRERLEASEVESVVIHAVYLINCASKDAEIRKKSLASLTQALDVGSRIGADGVVLHPGSTKGEPLDESIGRVAEALTACLDESEVCPILLENTAGAGGTIGRNFDELAAILERVGKIDSSLQGRVGFCLDSCHLFASGFEIGSHDSVTQVVDLFDRQIGIDRLRCIHLNDSKTPFASHRDRHENLGEGELGREGLIAFLGEPRFDGLPVILEVPGFGKEGPDRKQVGIANRLLKKAQS